MRYLKDGRIPLIISMAVFGTIGPLVRLIPLSSAEIALYRAAMAFVLIGLFLIITKRKLSFQNPKREIPILIASGIALAANWILLFEAYKYTTVSNATLSYYFAPVIVTVLSPILFKERITPMQIVCFVMSSVGIVLITGFGGGGESDTLGIILGLFAACFYATVVLLNKFMTKISGIERTFLQFSVATAVLLQYVAITDGFHLTSLSGYGIPALLTVGIIHTGICYCMYFSSISKLPGQKVALLGYIDPLVAVLISVFLLNEEILPLEIVGGIMILGFSLLNELLPYINNKTKNNKNGAL